MIPQGQTIAIGALRISSDAVEEVQDLRSVLAIKRDQIRSARLCHGFLARHPIIQIIFGTIMSGISGFFSIAGLAELKGGIIDFWTLSPILFVGLGIWVIFDATKRGYFLRVFTSHKSHKLLIGQSLSQREQADLERELGKF